MSKFSRTRKYTKAHSRWEDGKELQGMPEMKGNLEHQIVLIRALEQVMGLQRHIYSRPEMVIRECERIRGLLC